MLYNVMYGIFQVVKGYVWGIHFVLSEILVGGDVLFRLWVFGTLSLSSALGAVVLAVQNDTNAFIFMILCMVFTFEWIIAFLRS